MDKLTSLYCAMIEYFRGDPRRCQHLLKVASLARRIGIMEHAGSHTLFMLEAAGLIHDCGIRPGEAKYGAGRCTGKIQEQEGPAAAAEILCRLGFEQADIDRLCYLVGHHHTYTDIDGMDYQILVEADFLVNFYEDGTSASGIRNAVSRIFRTASGKKLAEAMFDL